MCVLAVVARSCLSLCAFHYISLIVSLFSQVLQLTAAVEAAKLKLKDAIAEKEKALVLKAEADKLASDKVCVCVVICFVLFVCVCVV